MARTFVSASSQYLEIDTPVITSYPFTMACKFKAVSITQTSVLMFVGDKDVANHLCFLSAHGTRAGDPVLAFSHSYGAGSSQFAETSTGFSAGIWHHACGVWDGSNSRHAYIDGGSKDTNSTGVNPIGASHDRTSIGRAGDSSPNYSDVDLAYAAIWTASLTDAEVASLSFYEPPFIRPESLVFYMKLIGDDDNDIVGGLHLTAFGGPTVSEHPPLIHQASPRIIPAPAGANAALLGTVC